MSEETITRICPACNGTMAPWKIDPAASLQLRCMSCGEKRPIGWKRDVGTAASQPIATNPLIVRAADKLALTAFDLVERGIIPTRTRLSDELEHYADLRFDVMDGSGIARLREMAKAQGYEVRS